MRTHDITQILQRWRTSDEVASELLPMVYDELRRLASRRLRQERRGHTLQTTDLVHEAFLRMVNQREADWQDRQHFFAVAAQAMRRILVDHARRHQAEKRIGHQRLVSLDDAPDLAVEPNLDILALDQALRRLETLDPRQAQVVELRAFAGLTLEDVAQILAISQSTVWREWKTAQLWLRREMDPAGSSPANAD